MVTPGRLCVAHLKRIHDEADFWEPWMDRLHPDERRAIAAGEIAVIRRPLEPWWLVGDWLDVASNLWLKPHKAKFTRADNGTIKYRIEFDLRDFRVTLPREVPQMFEPPELDDQGKPIPPSPDAIEAATIDGNYTAAAELAVPNVCESDLADQDRYADQAEMGLKQVAAIAQARRERHELDQRLRKARVEARIKGVDISSSERVIERQLLKIERIVFSSRRAA